MQVITAHEVIQPNVAIQAEPTPAVPALDVWQDLNQIEQPEHVIQLIMNVEQDVVPVIVAPINAGQVNAAEYSDRDHDIVALNPHNVPDVRIYEINSEFAMMEVVADPVDLENQDGDLQHFDDIGLNPEIAPAMPVFGPVVAEIDAEVTVAAQVSIGLDTADPPMEY